MNPSDEKTIEIARRTKKNLQYMQAQYDRGAPIYEFTQLFNSMLGMVLLLREDYFHGSDIGWDHVEKRLFVDSSLKSKASSFSQLITNTRHAFAHGNYRFISDEKMRIKAVEIWNVSIATDYNDRTKRDTWEWSAIYYEDELERIATLMLNYLEIEFGLEVNGPPSDPSDA